MKTLTFRFDIDTHKCIRDGVPKLLTISEKYDVPFTFFLNLGKAISFKESLYDIANKKHLDDKDTMLTMSAMQKLGIIDYFYAAIVNPSLKNYFGQIERLANSSSELGIHGGKNHALWHKYALNWNENKLESEINFAISAIKSIKPDYQLKGFASPGWTSPKCLPKVLERMGFVYYSDLRCKEREEIINCSNVLPNIGVNMLGEPGGVAYFEDRRLHEVSEEDILNEIVYFCKNNEHVVLYDHPYYSGIHELSTIERIINYCLSNGIKIVRLGDLI